MEIAGPLFRAFIGRLVCLVVLTAGTPLLLFGQSAQLRPTTDEQTLKTWLQNMVWYHRFSTSEIQQVTGLSEQEIDERLQQFQITSDGQPPRSNEKLLVLPYPGGRHPRIGFLDGAVDPLRETKLSVFCPWDSHSYVVMDVPEAIWSNLGLTWLAHTHIPTVWDKQGIRMPQQEWNVLPDGSFSMERTLPNGIVFGTRVTALESHLQMQMWLTNGTKETLTDLRVQNCVMLKGAEGFDQQTNDNKKFVNGFAVAGSADGNRWIITGWDPLHRAWGNAPCPCLHSDPKFPDCPPGETRFLRGWFSFYQGKDIDQELSRIEATGWRSFPVQHVTGNVTGVIRDAKTGKTQPGRLYVQNLASGEWFFAQSTVEAGSAVEYRKQVGNSASVEKHTTLSAHPFQLQLPPGRYRIRAERGKEFVPAEQQITVEDSPVSIELSLKRFENMAARGWYSGDTHVHRPLNELPNLMLAEDLNVALPLSYWVRDSTEIPAASGPILDAAPQYVDPTHVFYPVNTEYEIFTVEKRRHTQGAVFVLNHQKPLTLASPPSLPVAEEARRQGALLDLDKHSWNWSMMIVPIMNVDLFELSNNHNWRTQFGFPQWTLDVAPDWPEVEKNSQGFTETGWTEFAMQSYYALQNCGFRMRVTGGTGSGVHPVPLGHGRVYVCLSPENREPGQDAAANDSEMFRYETWIRKLNEGKSFVTTGPLMDLRFNGQLPGKTWTGSDVPEAVCITGQIHSISALKSLQIVVNGEVRQVALPEASKTADGTSLYDIDLQASFSGSSWIAVRCFEDLPDQKVSFAHTNPVYIDVPGQPLKPRRRDTDYFIRRMDEEIARNTGVLSEESLQEYHRARDIYRSISERAIP